MTLPLMVVGAVAFGMVLWLSRGLVHAAAAGRPVLAWGVGLVGLALFGGVVCAEVLAALGVTA